MEEIKDNGIVKFSFYLFGVGVLLAWNAILSIFDFFIYYVREFKIISIFKINLNLFPINFEISKKNTVLNLSTQT